MTPVLAESQFAGVHLNGVKWTPVQDDSACARMAADLAQSRTALMKQMNVGYNSRWATVIGLRVAPADDSAYGNLLYLVRRRPPLPPLHPPARSPAVPHSPSIPRSPRTANPRHSPLPLPAPRRHPTR